MKLYFAAPSPFARKVRVLVRELGLNDAIEEIAVHTTPVAPHGDVTELNPLSKIPTLVTGDGLALYDSRVIQEYLLSLTPEGTAHIADEAARWKSLRRQALADGIMDAGILHRYELVLRPEPLRWTEWLHAQEGKIRAGLAALAADVPPVDSKVGLDAVGAACALAWLEFRMPSIEWREEHPSLSRFLDAMSQRVSMSQTAP